MIQQLIRLAFLTLTAASAFAVPLSTVDGVAQSPANTAVEVPLPSALPSSSPKSRRSIDLESRSTSAASQSNYYSALVAIGASYTDNAHTRSANLAGSLRAYFPYSAAGGRYTDGAVAVEYMVQPTLSPALKQQSSGIRLIDYAYGGAVIQNGLSGTASSWPAATDQVTSYLSDVKSGLARVGTGRVLHYNNIGINTVSQLWALCLNGGLTSDGITLARQGITANVNAIAASIRSINADDTVYSTIHGADYLIVGIPQLDIVPMIANLIPPSYNAALRLEALALAGSLVDQFNAELSAFATAFKGEVRNGKAFWFDLAALWKDLQINPLAHGITASPVTKSCYSSATGSLCANPGSYLYFDTLHPVTSVHKLMAQRMNALVLGA